MPEEYLRPIPKSWWLRKPTYFAFMVRELTSVFVAGYAVFLLVLVGWAADLEAFGRFFRTLRSPWSVALHLVGLALVLFHTITWINLTPKVLVLWRGEERVSPALIAASNYLAWLVVSGVVAWVALR
jgi:fumarate reductase subunit C